MLIHIVRGDQYLWVLAQHRAERLQLLQTINRTRGVTRTVDHHHLCPCGDRRRQLLGAHLKALLDAGLDDNRPALCDEHNVGVGHPVGCGDDDLVTGIN